MIIYILIYHFGDRNLLTKFKDELICALVVLCILSIYLKITYHISINQNNSCTSRHNWLNTAMQDGGGGGGTGITTRASMRALALGQYDDTYNTCFGLKHTAPMR